MFSKRKIINVICLTIMVMILTQSFFVNGSISVDSHPLRISQTKKIVFAKHNSNFSPTNAYSDMAAYFASQGYTVEDIPTEINATVLASTSILFVNTYQVGPFSANEITAIENFVNSGGGLIASFVGGGLDFGCNLTTDLGVIGTHALEVSPHPITANIPLPDFPTGSAISNITLSGSAQTIVSTDPGSVRPNTTIVATNYYGDGKIMVSTVGTIWDNTYYSDGGNDNLIENYLKWYEDEGIKNFVFAKHNSNFSPTNAYSDMAAYFASQGYTVEDISTEINATVLASTSILFVNTYQVGSFSANEITAIENFVNSGGGLIASFVGGGLDLGCKITNYIAVLGNNNLEVSPHPITANIPTPIISTISGFNNITLSGSAQTIVSTDPGSDYPNATMIATNYYGEGKIMVSTIGSIWGNADFTDGGNDNLIENYLKWFEDDGIKNFLFAENNGYFSPTNASSELAHYIASFGYIITELIDQDPTETILSTTDILLINSYQETSGYSTDSLTAIEEWVANGGALIVEFRGIATDFGLHMYTFGQPDLLYNNETYHIFYHPVTSGITNITKSVQGSVAEFDLAESATVIVATTADSTNPERPIIAVNNYDEGKVMASAIPLWDKNFDFDENKELMKNFIDWVTINTTTPSPSISTHPDISYNESTFGNNLTWTMESYYPYYFELLLDGEDYLSGTWSSLPLKVNIDGLPNGTYTFAIHIYDHYGRTASDTVLVTVTQVTGTTTTSTAPFSFLGTLLGVSMVISLTFYRRRKRN